MDKYQETLDSIKRMNIFRRREDGTEEGRSVEEYVNLFRCPAKPFDTIQEALNELQLTRKALLICASKLGYEEDKCDKCEFGGNFEPETQEEAQAISIDHQYTRPKKIAHKMLEIAKTDRYNLQTDIALKYWDSEVANGK